MGRSLPRPPHLLFTLKAAQPGNKVAIRWKHNRGETRQDDVAVA